jgi:mono/diheme cytochrome c family protein
MVNAALLARPPRSTTVPEVAMWKLISLVVITIAGASPALAAGSFDVPQLFASTCGFCHENGGRVAGKGPKLAGTARSDAFIIDRIKNGKEGAMPAFEGALNNRQIKGIVAYIRNLKDTGQ